MVDFLPKRLEFYQKGKHTNTDQQFKKSNCQGGFLKYHRYQNRDSDSEHVENEKELSEEVVLSKTTENDLDTCPMFVKGSAWSLLCV